MKNEIVNRVAQSPLVTIDLEELYDHQERVVYDLKHNLYEGIILKEKDFRNFLRSHDWSQYTGKHVAITCSAEAIIPTWAYMLLTAKLEPFAKTIIYGDLDALENELFRLAIAQIDIESYRDKKVVIKGCSKLAVPDFAYVEIVKRFRPVVSSILFGEPCSTVPVFKAPRK